MKPLGKPEKRIFITKLSLKVKFLQVIFVSKDNVVKLKIKDNWDAGFNILIFILMYITLNNYM